MISNPTILRRKGDPTRYVVCPECSQPYPAPARAGMAGLCPTCRAERKLILAERRQRRRELPWYLRPHDDYRPETNQSPVPIFNINTGAIVELAVEPALTQ